LREAAFFGKGPGKIKKRRVGKGGKKGNENNFRKRIKNIWKV
jgi:hypothetical protein